MAVSRISSFNWDKILSKVGSAEIKKSVNGLRGKSNEVVANSGKFVKAPAAIDFSAYKSKLKLTSAAVDSLEAVYKNRKLPTYSASLPAFEAKKRAQTIAVVQSTVEAAKADLANLKAQLELFEKIRITDETSVAELRNRFPAIAKEIEAEIKDHDWLKDSK